MTLKVWNAGEQVQHADLNTNFDALNTAIGGNTSAIAGNTAALATTTHNPAVAAQDMGGFRVSNAARAAAITDLARLDQVAETYLTHVTIGDPGFPAGTVNVTMSLPVGSNKFCVKWSGLSPTLDNNPLIIRMAAGGDFFAGTSDYLAQSLLISNTTQFVAQGNYAYIGATAAMPLSTLGNPSLGFITFLADGDHAFDLRSRGLVSGGSYTSLISGGRCNQGVGARMTSILFGVTGGIAAGSFVLSGVS